MGLKFTKMHGLGNDFIIIDNLDGKIQITSDQIRFISNRYTGIGFDQMVMVCESNNPDADVLYKIFNADGNEAEQSGNGVRCLGKYLIEKNILSKTEFTVENIKGLIKINVIEDGIQVNMGRPVFEPDLIPINTTNQQREYNIDIKGSSVSFYSLSMGNPHAVILVDDIASADVPVIGPQVQESGFFPQGVNVGFMQIVNRESIKLRVYERGAGETLACGSGSCAAVVAGIMDDKLDNSVKVDLPGGSLAITWGGGDSEVWMTGPATTVFEGRIDL